MKDTKFSRIMLEAGKIFSAVIIITVPIVYSNAYTLDWHIGFKIALWAALLIDYIFVFHILDKACEANDKVKVNKKKDIKEEIEENHQITIDKFLEEKDKEERLI